jgi:CubicO group peptidase (beta-lactamase class C family)
VLAGSLIVLAFGIAHLEDAALGQAASRVFVPLATRDGASAYPPPATTGVATVPIPTGQATPTAAGTVTVPPVPTPTATVSGALAEKSRQVDAIVNALVTAGGPGGAILVAQNGQVVHRAGYGLADIDRGVANTTRTVFHMASVSKQMTTLAIQMLAQDGRLRYDDPLSQHIPELARFGSGVTIRRLMHHTAGMPSYDDEPLNSALLRRSAEPRHNHLVEALVDTGELKFTPGDRFDYSNTGYDVLGAVIERVSGQAYPTFLQTRMFGPLAMSQTFALPNANRTSTPNLAHSYRRRDGAWTVTPNTALDNLGGSGATYSTVEDLFIYDQALYGDRIVTQATLAEAFVPATLNSGARTDYGFAFEIGSRSGVTYHGHSGGWLSFATYYARFPSRQLGVIVLMNSDRDTQRLALDIADVYLRDRR